MIKNICAASVASILLLTVQVSQAQDEIQLDSDDKKFSYSVGNRIGQQLQSQFASQPGFDVEAFLAGMESLLMGQDSLMSEEEIINAIQQKQQEQLAEATALAEQKVAAGEAYMQENGTRDGVIQLASGIQYEIITEGDTAGVSPVATDTVLVHYQGTLIDGTVFDSSYSRGEPAQFSLGSIIKGWGEVLQLMKPGDKWSVVIPPELAYGERGAGQTIGPNETLLFDIELLEVKQSANQ